MSCENNTNRVSATAGVHSGINAIQSKFSGVTGRMVAGLNRRMEQVSGTVGNATGQAVQTVGDASKKVGTEIAAIPGKVSHTSGEVVGGVNRKRGQAATAALRTLESFDGPKSITSLEAAAVLVEVGTMLTAAKMFTKPLPMMPAMTFTKKDPASGEVVSVTLPREPVPPWSAQWMDKRRQQPDPYNIPKPKTDHESSHDKKPVVLPLEVAEKNLSLVERLSRISRSRSLMGIGLLRMVQASTTFAGTGIARLTRTDQSGIVDGVEQHFFFPQTSKISATVWQSKLTPLINLVDAWPSKVLKSEGVMFNLNGKTWHRGTLVIQTAAGERTITHLQSLNSPATHYYFGRKLLLNEAVGIVSGQKGFDAKHLPDIPDGRPATGYAGQVSEVESLFPIWAAWKKSLIMTHLRWGDNPAGTARKGSQISQDDIVPSASQLQPDQQGGRSRRPDNQRHDRRDKRGPEAGSNRPAADPNTEAAPAKTHELHPLDNIGNRVEVNGQEYKVMIRRVQPGSAGQPAVADATYFDETAGVWKEVTDPATRQKLAAQVEAGMVDTWE